jgi:anaerobic nitric oxide reductase flavorubredoxin
MGKKLTDKVTWVGKVDWTSTKFHGEEYSTHKGTSYNSYLVRDNKTVLIDTVSQPFSKEFIENLKQETGLGEIDYIVSNHAEPDHSGAMAELMREIPDTPVYCTANGIRSLKGHYHQDWNFVPVKTGDMLDLGKNKLVFMEAPMLHWPDSMFTYLTGEGVLFSNDAFGQHFATESLYNDTVDRAELYQEAIKYYANILAPFSPLVISKIIEVLGFSLPINMICPSHGVIWRDRPAQIVEQYVKWANDYQENQITLVFDSMWESTRKIAEAIAQGIQNADQTVTVKIFNAATEDKNDILTEVFKSKAILAGSATVNCGSLSSIARLIQMMRGLKLKNKKAAAFGSYGWSGEAVKQMSDNLVEAGFTLVNNGIRTLWVPDEKAIQECISFGVQFAKALNNEGRMIQNAS